MLTAAILGNGSFVHEFYVSLTEIRFNPGSSRFEITMRLFPDDVDRALYHSYGFSTHLGTELESERDDSLFHLYLKDHFSVSADGSLLPLTYLGKEREGEAIWCYLESEQTEKPVTLEIRNTMLTDEFEDQVNIIQVYATGWNRGMLLDRSTPQERIRLGE